MSGTKLDAKLAIMLGATVIAGFFGARSLIASEPGGDTGFDGAEQLPLRAVSDSTPPLEFIQPAEPRNPFAEQPMTPTIGAGPSEEDATGPTDIGIFDR